MLLLEQDTSSSTQSSVQACWQHTVLHLTKSIEKLKTAKICTETRGGGGSSSASSSCATPIDTVTGSGIISEAAAGFPAMIPDLRHIKEMRVPREVECLDGCYVLHVLEPDVEGTVAAGRQHVHEDP